MKKGICCLLIVGMVLFFGSMAMAGEEKINYDAAYDARVYHESIGPSTTVGGYKLGVNFRYVTSDTDDMLLWRGSVLNHEVKFVNTVSGDTFIGSPQYCYDTPPDANCDFNVWFGNRLNVSDNASTSSSISPWEVYIDGNPNPDKTLYLPNDTNINIFKFPEIHGGKSTLVKVGDQILITYSTDVYPAATLKLIVYDSNYNIAFSQAPMIQGSKLFLYVPASLSGNTARLQMNYSTIRKSTFFKLP